MKDMTAWHPYQRIALGMIFISSLASSSLAQDKPGAEPEKEPEIKVKPKVQSPDRAVSTEAPPQVTQGLGAFGKVLPVGEKNLDVKIPSFKDGVPSSTVRAGSMVRMDDDNMQMEKMDIRLYGESHDKDVRIQLATAIYNMPSQILASNTRSRVSRDDFDLQGDSMVFDTRTQQGKMVGNVRMVIYDSDSFAQQPKGADPKKDEKKPGETLPASTTPAPTPAPESSTSPTANDKK